MANRDSTNPNAYHSRTNYWKWEWQDRHISVAHEYRGSGPRLLLLPAFSTVSTRQELARLAKRLANEFECCLVDWPGFGDSQRARFRCEPELYRAFAEWVIDRLRPTAIVVAGHGSGYVAEVVSKRANASPRLVLLSPTWRGPLPTVMGQHPRPYAFIRWIMRLPMIGHLLYRLNTTKAFIGLMSRRHVYADPDFVSESLLERLQRTARGSTGARFASTAFVTGLLDPVSSTGQLQVLLKATHEPALIVVGSATPPRSAMDMTALCDIESVRCVESPGALACYEEYPDAVAGPMIDFLQVEPN